MTCLEKISPSYPDTFDLKQNFLQALEAEAGEAGEEGGEGGRGQGGEGGVAEKTAPPSL